MEIHLSNLLVDTSASQVLAFFGSGPQDSAFNVRMYAVREMPSRIIRTFAYIFCEDAAAGVAAIARCNGKTLLGNEISCSMAG